MSRDKRGNRTQEVVGSRPISSTKTFNYLAEVLTRNENCECLVSRLVRIANRFPGATLGLRKRWIVT